MDLQSFLIVLEGIFEFLFVVKTIPETNIGLPAVVLILDGRIEIIDGQVEFLRDQGLVAHFHILRVMVVLGPKMGRNKR